MSWQPLKLRPGSIVMDRHGALYEVVSDNGWWVNGWNVHDGVNAQTFHASQLERLEY